MRVLLTNNTLGARAGSEMYLCDVARELKRLGHEPAAYSPCLGVVADLLRAAGIPVVADLALLPFRPDVIHGHHHIETITALASLPGVPAIYFCHGAKPWEEMPPVFPRILRYVAVDLVCRERVLRETGVPEERVRMILNFVDPDVFKPREPLPARPARALVFSNYATQENYAASVRAACEQLGLTMDMRGLYSGNPALAPQDLLPEYDLVFAKGRAAIEAMAVGCAVVLCDGAGLGPMVSTGNFAELRPNNFGFRTLRNPPTVEAIVAAIQAYDASDAAGVRDLVRTQADVRASVSEIVRLYGEVVAENAERPADATAELRAAGAYLQTLDTIIKYGELKEALALPAVGPPDAIALPPPAVRG
jgi:glycosyltransferase involved in cell wall biosynthesis